MTALIAVACLIAGLVLADLAHTLLWRRWVKAQRARTAALEQNAGETEAG